THHYTQNIDLKDAKTVLSNSGTAIMGSAKAEGENRAKDAIVSALDSPLLNDNKINGAKNVLLLIVSGGQEITIDEIGEINDYIQSEAGYNANIIMGVGEDESLADSIAVTVIATGFNVEQQKEIVNAEPKKIIHSLDENQPAMVDLSEKTFVAPLVSTSTAEDSKNEKVVFELLDDLEVVEAKHEMGLVPTTDTIRNMEVSFEIVDAEGAHHLMRITPEIREIVVRDPEFVIVETSKPTMTYDTPREKVQGTTLLFELDPVSTNEIKVNEPVQVIPVTEVNKEGVIRYSLEEYMEVENELISSKPIEQIVAEPQPEEMNITMKKVEETPKFEGAYDAIDPMEMTIEETLRLRAEERRKKLKDFNYKFHNHNRIDEMEKVPAYKRVGTELKEPNTSGNTSRMSLGTDSNDDIQLRSNNSFLHDNVD
ncbi:MAG: cell division protein FtsZ, partial [Flavobacterium sp.]